MDQVIFKVKANDTFVDDKVKDQINSIMPSPLDINKTEVSIYPNETSPEHILISQQVNDDNSYLSTLSRLLRINSKSSMGVTPEK